MLKINEYEFKILIAKTKGYPEKKKRILKVIQAYQTELVEVQFLYNQDPSTGSGSQIFPTLTFKILFKP
jgi:hypothetical protein